MTGKDFAGTPEPGAKLPYIGGISTAVAPPRPAADLSSVASSISMAYDQATTTVAKSEVLGDPDSTEVTLAGVDVPETISDADIARLGKEDANSLNLRKIKRLREQGKVSAAGAKLLAAQAVQQGIANNPSKAKAILQTAGTFFGDFGEGDDLLQLTQAEKQQQSLTDAMKKQAATHGLFVLDRSGNVVVTPAHLQQFQEGANKLYQIDIDNKTIENRFNNGKVVASDLERMTGNFSHTETVKILGQMMAAQQQNGGLLLKPEEAQQQIEAARINTYRQIDRMASSRTSDGKALMTAEQRQAMYTHADKYFESIKTYAGSAAFQTVMKNRASGLRDYAAVLGIHAMPTLAMAENVAPGASKYLMEMLPRMMKLSPDQREVLMANDPHLKLLWSETVAAQKSMDAMRNMVTGVVPPLSSDPLGFNSTVGTALSVLKDPAAKEESPDLHQKAVDAMISAGKQDSGILDQLTRYNLPSQISPEQATKVQNVAAYHLNNLRSALFNRGRDLREPYAVTVQNGKIVLAPTELGERLGEMGNLFSDVEGAAPNLPPPSHELQSAVDSANQTLKVLNAYQNHPAFKTFLAGKTPADYVNMIIRAGNGPEQVGKVHPNHQYLLSLARGGSDEAKVLLGKAGIKDVNKTLELAGRVLADPQVNGVVKKGNYMYDPYRNTLVPLSE